MTLDDRYSAWLDGELDDAEIVVLEAELAADEALAAEFDALRSVRDLIRAEAMLAMPASSLDRIVAAVKADGVETATPAAPPVSAAPAPVVDLASRRRRVPTFAAVAASFAIIVSIVGGLGGSSTLPAVGDLIARHDAAAAEMPEHDSGPMDDMPAMPGAMEMAHSETIDEDLVHAVYITGTGSVVSVFRQEGELDIDGLVDEMDGGDTGEMAGHPMWVKDVDDLHVVVVDGDGYVWTFINHVDEPMDSMMDDMMDELPTRSSGVRERLHDVAEAIVEPFGLGF
ncbi:MAG: RseA family anti-sigma factor [Actinomycetota bacterium]